MGRAFGSAVLSLEDPPYMGFKHVGIGTTAFAGPLLVAAFLARPRTRRTEAPETMHHRWQSQGPMAQRGLGEEFSTANERKAERQRRSDNQLESPREVGSGGLLLSLAQVVAVGSVTVMTKFYFWVRGGWWANGEAQLLEAVTGRRAGQGLFTVSNHASVADDLVLAKALPVWLAAQ